MRKLLVILFILISVKTFGQDLNYYIRNGGDDSYTGFSDAQAWATIAKLETITLQPNDTVFFKRGSTWKEQYDPTGDGTYGNKIVLTTYGTGAKPIITARDTIIGSSNNANWVPAGTNIWKMEYTETSAYIKRLWIDDIEQQRPQLAVNLNSTYTFYDSSSVNRLYVYHVGNPGDHTIEHGMARTYAIFFNTDNYFDVINLDLRGGYNTINIQASDCINIDSCEIGNSSILMGIIGQGSSGNHSDSCNITRCNIDSGLELKSNWEAQYCTEGIEVYGANNWTIHDNKIRNWGHAGIYVKTLLAGSTNNNISIYKNDISSPDIDYGRALNVDCYLGNCSDLKIYRNYIHNLPTQMQINSTGAEFYYNVVDSIVGVPFRAGVGSAISITGYESTTRPRNMKFYNNVFSNINNSGIWMAWYSTAYQGSHDNEFINNIFYNCNSYAISVYNADSIYNNTFKNNIIYKNGTTNVISYRGTAMDVSTFNTSDAEGDTIQNNNGDSPRFESGTFELSMLSTNAINQGIDVGLIEDFLEMPINGLPDIGAYEWYSEDIPVTGETFGISTDSTYFLKNSDGKFLIYPK